MSAPCSEQRQHAALLLQTCLAICTFCTAECLPGKPVLSFTLRARSQPEMRQRTERAGEERLVRTRAFLATGGQASAARKAA